MLDVPGDGAGLLRSPGEPVRAKICGITRPSDAEVAVRYGAWAVGFVLWPGSRRALRAEDAAAVVAAVKGDALTVAVFVNATAEEILRARDLAKFDLVQLHGDEPPGLAEELGLPFLRAIRPRVVADLELARPFTTLPGFQGLLVDAAVTGAYGGTGRLADAALARAARALGPVVLAGGLTPDNVALRIRAGSPDAVDVSGGVEESPGLKRPDQIRLFLERVRLA